MIFIKKGSVPKIFSDAKRNNRNYDELIQKTKDPLKRYLIKEQGGLCAYCMGRICLDNSTIEHYIPRHGKNGDISKSLDYDNLFAVCYNERNNKTNKKIKPPLGHCDVSRCDEKLKIDPRKECDIAQVEYKRDGEIYSDNKDFEIDLDKTLNLNIQTLKNNRKAAYDSAFKTMAQINKNNWKEDFVIKQINMLKNKEEKTEYIGIILYFLSKRVKRTI